MLVIHVLGSGSGWPSARRDTTSLLVHAAEGWSLIDCPGSVVHKLAQRGVGLEQLRRVLLTHDHVDHLYGLPHLVHAMGVRGECEPLPVFGLASTLATARGLLQALGLRGARYPQIRWGELPEEPSLVYERQGLRIRAAPADHSRPTLAVRFDTPEASWTHSADTRPCDPVVQLARQAQLLTHDCAGPDAVVGAPGFPHSTALQAGRVAAAAGVQELRLIHLSRAAEQDEAALIQEASEVFEGVVETAHDGDLYRLPRNT